LFTLRLAEAVASRELLLRELAAIMRQETKASRIVIAETGEDNSPRVVVAHGCAPQEAARLADELAPLKTEEERERYAKKNDASLIALRSANAAPAILYLAPRDQAALPISLSLEPLLRIVELGMDVWPTSEGEDLYRRSVYTFWRRIVTYPTFAVFDAPAANEPLVT
jgi:hypothetical protein